MTTRQLRRRLDRLTSQHADSRLTDEREPDHPLYGSVTAWPATPIEEHPLYESIKAWQAAAR